MKTTDNTVLITGGGSGIGLAIASALAQKGNRIIITGRNEAKLKAAAATLPNTTPIVSDITNADDVDQLIKQINADFGGIDILVNNAGTAFAYQLSATADAYGKAKQEMEVNYFSIIRLTEKLLPTLAEKEESAIVNISSVAAFVPIQFIATYSATKAALHAYTQTLRLTLEQTTPTLKVFEVFPPFVATEMTKGLTIPMLPPSAVADDLLAGLAQDQFEIKTGATKDMYQHYLSSPEAAVRTYNSAA
ncbi:SDR family oxidoreductase [Spirosoma soli]|uniref:SDR family oxidoreductase n=1 Tax=Spirosoma soli TaxID=1770529 RepID=A0ABW5M726_9BACT